tara:strand:+ start:202 stop:1104 length:903 start_codon:yes stop_codon:yes gene_type:complete
MAGSRADQCASSLGMRAAAMPDRTMNDVTILLSRLALGLPFTFVHFNDGETAAAMYQPGVKRSQQWRGLCETPLRNQVFSGALRRAVRAAMNTSHPLLYAGVPCSAEQPTAYRATKSLVRARLVTSATIFQNGNWQYLSSQLPALLRARLRRGAQLHLVVSTLADVKRFSRTTGLAVASTLRAAPVSSFDSYASLRLNYTHFQPNDVVVLCVGMLGRLLATTWLQHRPRTTFLELGSFFNPMLFAVPIGNIRVRMAYHRTDWAVPCSHARDVRARFAAVDGCLNVSQTDVLQVPLVQSAS